MADASGTTKFSSTAGNQLPTEQQPFVRDTVSSGNPTRHNYYFADANGNITYMTDASQTTTAQYRYDPLGNTISSSGSMSVLNTYRFSSKEIHELDETYPHEIWCVT